MGIASGMKELTQDIASSHEDRAKRLGEIKEGAKQVRGETQNLMRGIQTSRKDTGTQLRRDLAQDKAHRKSETTEILKEAQGLLKDFGTSRKEASSQLRKDLSAGAANRRSEVKETLKEAQDLTKAFETSRKGMTSELRKELAQSKASTKSEVKALLKSAQKLVKDFEKSHKEMGNILRRDLTQNRASRESEVKEMQGDFRKAQAEVRADLKETAAAWQELANIIQPKRAGVKVPQEKGRVKVPVMEKEEALVPEEEAVSLEAKLRAMITLHPEGISLAEVAQKVGVAPIVLGRAAKSLMESGKIRKEDRLYFPVVSE